MQVKRKSNTLNAVQYLGPDSSDECVDMFDHATLTRAMDGGLLHTDLSSSSLPKHTKIREGSWLVEHPVTTFIILTNARFMMEYEKSL